VIDVANENNNLSTFISLLMLAVCAAAIVDPRFRKLCWSLICKL
jgi:hypothetical protein